MVINIYLPLDKESNSTLDTGHWTVTEFSRREKISMCLVAGGCWCACAREHVTLPSSSHLQSHSTAGSSHHVYSSSLSRYNWINSNSNGFFSHQHI